MEIESILQEEKQKDYFKQLMSFIDDRYKQVEVYPPKAMLFNCFKVCDMNNIKVVILGQDPYHQKGQAMGLSFSVAKDVKIPPSLNNIYKELEADMHITKPSHGDLTSWAKQGVLLMNTVMSVEAGKANAHQGRGWEQFTDRIMQELNTYQEPLVFILWGKPAQNKAKWITNEKHLLLKSVHPSPLSAHRGFFGSKPFSKANAFLEKHQRGIIDWSITS